MERYRRLFREGAREGFGDGFAASNEIVKVIRSDSAEGVVTKFTQRVPRKAGEPRGEDGLETESVIIPMIGRKGVRTHTLCVSSQVGCAMGCGFCQTAQMGLVRSLTVREIVGQWWAARHVVDGGCPTIQNIVFMGMGEPMDNLDAVIGAIGVLTDQNGVGLPMSKITVSTVGRLDGLAKLGEEVRRPGWHRLNLAVSLNAPSDEVRSTIMPINRAMPMRALREAILAWPIYGGAKICFEYVLIPGVNDSAEHCQQLADYMQGRGVWGAEDGKGDGGGRGLPGLVNLIPYNPREDSPWEAPSEESVIEFLNGLLDRGVFAKRRRTKGRDQMAACGQLGNLEYRRKKAKGSDTNRI